MATAHQKKRPVVRTTNIKVGLALAAVGASIGGWATMGLHGIAGQAAAAAGVQQTAATTSTQAAAAPATTTGTNSDAQSSTSINSTASDTQLSTSGQQSITSLRPMARTRASR